MKNFSIDTFAETNPAFCSLVIFNFCKGFYSETKEGTPFPLVILPLPILLSDELMKTFKGTNIKTGLFRWAENNPEVFIDLSIRINDSSEFLKPGIQYGLYKKILHIDSSGNLTPANKSIKSIKPLELDYLFKSAERLGNWIGQINSIKTIYNFLGIQL